MKAILLRNLSKNRYLYLYSALIFIAFGFKQEKNIPFFAFYFASILMSYTNKEDNKSEALRRTYPISVKKIMGTSFLQAGIFICVSFAFISIISIIFKLPKESFISYTAFSLYIALNEYGDILSLSKFSKVQMAILVITLILSLFIALQSHLTYLDKYFYFLLLGMVLVIINTSLIYEKEKNNYYLEGKS